MNLEESIEMTIQGCGAQLYDIVTTREHDRRIYRIFITSQDGINLDKCAEVSRLISPILDIDEPLSGEYALEVSSPGIERRLKKMQHYKASIGDMVKIKDFDKNILKGKLLEVDKNEIKIDTEHGIEIITYDEISSASTYYEW